MTKRFARLEDIHFRDCRMMGATLGEQITAQ